VVLGKVVRLRRQFGRPGDAHVSLSTRHRAGLTLL
jgi:hypothetical protein